MHSLVMITSAGLNSRMGMPNGRAAADPVIRSVVSKAGEYLESARSDDGPAARYASLMVTSRCDHRTLLHAPHA